MAVQQTASLVMVFEYFLKRSRPRSPLSGNKESMFQQRLVLLRAGIGEEKLLEEYPSLKREDIRASLVYASKILRGEEIIPIGA
jgi:hypothetical protein